VAVAVEAQTALRFLRRAAPDNPVVRVVDLGGEEVQAVLVFPAKVVREGLEAHHERPDLDQAVVVAQVAPVLLVTPPVVVVAPGYIVRSLVQI
jgi:hypothetical protein